jgi:hypothetical protein
VPSRGAWSARSLIGLNCSAGTCCTDSMRACSVGHIQHAVLTWAGLCALEAGLASVLLPLLRLSTATPAVAAASWAHVARIAGQAFRTVCWELSPEPAASAAPCLLPAVVAASCAYVAWTAGQAFGTVCTGSCPHNLLRAALCLLPLLRLSAATPAVAGASWACWAASPPGQHAAQLSRHWQPATAAPAAAAAPTGRAAGERRGLVQQRWVRLRWVRLRLCAASWPAAGCLMCWRAGCSRRAGRSRSQ